MKYLLIVNPRSGDGSAPRKVETVVRYFQRHGLPIEVRLTDRPGHAAELAREAAVGDVDVIIGGGGDGTINEVLNGMIGSGKRLAILPWGTGNVFAAEMRFPRRLRAACRLIRRGGATRLDVGRCGTRHFLLMAGAGFDAYSLKLLEGQAAKRRFGMFAYALAALKAFTRYRYPQIEVQLDGGRRDSGSFVLVSNTSRYGAGLSFTPRATPLDGRLDVFVFRETGRWYTFMLALRYLVGSIIDRRPGNRPPILLRSNLYRARRVELASAHPVLTQVDGELHSSLPASVEVVPSAIEVILPQRSVRKFRRMAERSSAEP